MVFIKTLMDVDQICSYLLKQKLTLCIGPKSNYKNTIYGYKKECFHFVYKIQVSSIGKTAHPPPENQMGKLAVAAPPPPPQ